MVAVLSSATPYLSEQQRGKAPRKLLPFVASLPVCLSVCLSVHNEMAALGNCSARHMRLKSIFICSLSIRRQLAIDDRCVIGMLLGVTAVGRQESELPAESRI